MSNAAEGGGGEVGGGKGGGQTWAPPDPAFPNVCSALSTDEYADERASEERRKRTHEARAKTMLLSRAGVKGGRHRSRGGGALVMYSPKPKNVDEGGVEGGTDPR